MRNLMRRESLCGATVRRDDQNQSRKQTYRMFGYRNTELYRHDVRFDCSIAHSKALGD